MGDCRVDDDGDGAGGGEEAAGTGVPVFFFPLDFAFAVRRYLRVLRPSLVVLVESELWPRLLVECAAGCGCRSRW